MVWWLCKQIFFALPRLYLFLFAWHRSEDSLSITNREWTTVMSSLRSHKILPKESKTKWHLCSRQLFVCSTFILSLVCFENILQPSLFANYLFTALAIISLLRIDLAIFESSLFTTFDVVFTLSFTHWALSRSFQYLFFVVLVWVYGESKPRDRVSLLHSLDYW